MFRIAIASLLIGLGTAAVAHSPPVAWPLRATVTDLAGRPVTFHALAFGGDLIIPVGPPSGTPVIRRLARGDTLSATTPAQYPLDLTRGSVVFFTSGKDSIRVVVGRNPDGATDRVSAEGHRLAVRLVNGTVVIETQ
jgi:hypothetical protein